MKKFLQKHQEKIFFTLILVIGFILRIILVNKVIVGDILAYVEWGQKIWEWGSKTFYFGEHPWYYSPPNYPPVAALLFGGLDWLFRHRYVTAQLHNLIKIPPAAFIIYFYKFGDILLYKLLPILSDLALGAVIYKLILALTKNTKKALLGMTFFVLNPITVFISGAWGQTDSLVAIFGLLAFITLVGGKYAWAIFLFFVSMYLKPSWGIFAPFFLFVLYLKKPSIKQLLIAAIPTLIALIVVTIPFAEKGVLAFTKAMWVDKYIIPVKSVGKASVSAFNFYTIFLKIDRSLFNSKLLFIPINKLSLFFFAILNIFAFSFAKKSKSLLWGVIVGIFTIGFGSFLFMVNMLERYFFPALAPIVIIMFTDIKALVPLVISNIFLFANIIWSFYRRGSDEIDHPFTNNNFLLIRLISTSLVAIFVYVLKNVKIQFSRVLKTQNQ